MPRPRSAATKGVITSTVLNANRPGTPSVGKTSARLYQSSSWRRTGIARKNQMYPSALADSTGLADRRITANSTPSTTPISIARTAIRTVLTRPCRMMGAVRKLPT